MKAVAYCRVSTNKDEQLDSLDAQQRFFTEYSLRNGFELIRIYADEGKSGTKMKNRTELLKMLSDANRSLFETVLIKDVSRLARNTVDFLTSIRKLKVLGVKVVFVNYDQTSSDSSEFMLTMLSAIAQEESANTSKRVKFGKKINAEKGRVPNIIYGYDKTVGDYYNLSINAEEATVVRTIFDMYVENHSGAGKIARELNNKGIKTKRGCPWSQNAVSRILANEIYIGRIINGKQEVEDFLTGRRRNRTSGEWVISERPDLAIIDASTFERAAEISEKRKDRLNLPESHSSDLHIFSRLIKCARCGFAFRRSVRTYKNTYVKWVCTGRNLNGADFCPDNTVVDENELLTSICSYFSEQLKEKTNAAERIASEFRRGYRAKCENAASEKDITSQLIKLKKIKEKYTEMYLSELITIDELREKCSELSEAIDRLSERLKSVNINAGGFPSGYLSSDIDSLVTSAFMSSFDLSRIIEKIEVDEHRNVDVYIKQFGDNVQNCDNSTYGCKLIERLKQAGSNLLSACFFIMAPSFSLPLK